MAIKFLSLFGRKLKTKSSVRAAPQGDGNSPDVPVPEKTLTLLVQDKFDVDRKFCGRWFRFSSETSTLIAAMTISFTAFDSASSCRVNSSSSFRFFRSANQRYFLAVDKEVSDGSYLNIIPLTEDNAGVWVNIFRHSQIPFSDLAPSTMRDITNAKVEKVEILNQTVFDSIIPNY